MTAARGFENDVRFVLRRARIDPAQLAALIRDMARAVGDYQRRAARQKPKADAATGARNCAEDLARQLAALERLIRKRMPVADPAGTLSFPVRLETLFLVGASSELLPIVKRWRATAEAEAARWTRPAQRPMNEARAMLECEIADVLDRAGVRLSKTPNGALARVFRDAVFPAIGLSPRNGQRAARAAIEHLDEWRTLPAWHRHLPPVPEPAEQIR